MLQETHNFEFGEFVLDPREKVLFRNGAPVPVAPKVLQLLLVLIENHDHIVEKEKLMDEVWADSFVEESNLTYSIRQLRKILGDDTHDPRFIETVPRRGYRFIVPISIENTRNSSPESLSAIHQTAEGSSSKYFSRPVFFSAGFLILAAIVLTAGLVAFRDRRLFGGDRQSEIPQFRDLKFDQVAKFDNYTSASISPDGKFAAYINTVNGQQSLWLRQLGTGQSNQIVAAEEGVRILLIEFSADGEYIYFSRRSNNQPAHVDRVPVFGGVIQANIVTGLETEFSISPDQSLVSFHRSHDGKTTLFAAKTGLTDSRALFETEHSITGNSFSPDGRMIAFASGDVGPGKTSFGVYTINVDGGPPAEASKERWNYVRDVVWLSDGKGILVTAQTSNNSPRQIWKVDLPEGNVKKVTETQENLSYISVTKDQRHILISENSLSSNLYVAPTNDSASVKMLTTAYLGVSWTPDGDIVYSSSNGNEDIWRISPDGSNQRQLTTSTSMDFTPIVSSDGQYIVYLSDRAGKLNLWRMNSDGTSQLQLTNGNGEQNPFITPDGTNVIFSSVENGKLFSVPITGGEASEVQVDGVSDLNISPDGAFFAHFAGKEADKKIVLRSSQGSVEPREIAITAGYFAGHELVWSKDGRSVNYAAQKNRSFSNIWRQPIDGSPPTQLTNFGSEAIFFFDFSIDGSKLALIRGSWSYDIVLATVPLRE
jgi:DNA-binding winged helix-turn-helix (wHTH) protein/Tol biopolymer transport system component